MVTWLHVYHLIFFKFIYWCTWSHVTIDNYWFFTLILLVFGRRVLDKLGCFKKSKYIEISFSFQLTAFLLSRWIIIHIFSISSAGGSMPGQEEDISPYATFHLLGMREEAKNGKYLSIYLSIYLSKPPSTSSAWGKRKVEEVKNGKYLSI